MTATGDTAKAAEAMAARLRAAGFAEVTCRCCARAAQGQPCGAAARYRRAQADPAACAYRRGEANREDWSIDPFKLIEKDGYYYGRGTGDDKFMAAAFVTNMIRYKQEGYRPDRDIILALETDEEILDRDELGIRWLLKNHRDLIDAEFALNEGGGVGLKDGKPIRNSVQTAREGLGQLHAGGRRTRAATARCRARQRDLSAGRGLVRLSKFEFPVRLNETTRAYLRACRPIRERADRGRHARRPGWQARPGVAVVRAPVRPIRSTMRSSAPPASRRCWKAATP